MISKRLVTGAVLIAAIVGANGCGDSPKTTPATASNSSSSAATSSTTESTGASSSTSTSTSASTAIGGPPATCSKAGLTKSVTDAGKAKGEIWVLDGVQCADGWAATTVTVNSQYDSTFIFEAEGQFWILKDRAKVCPKPSPVPAAIYQAACETN